MWQAYGVVGVQPMARFVQSTQTVPMNYSTVYTILLGISRVITPADDSYPLLAPVPVPTLSLSPIVSVPPSPSLA